MAETRAKRTRKREKVTLAQISGYRFKLIWAKYGACKYKKFSPPSQSPWTRGDIILPVNGTSGKQNVNGKTLTFPLR